LELPDIRYRCVPVDETTDGPVRGRGNWKGQLVLVPGPVETTHFSPISFDWTTCGRSTDRNRKFRSASTLVLCTCIKPWKKQLTT